MSRFSSPALARGFLRGVLIAAVALSGLWAGFALWFQLPFAAPLKLAAIGGFLGLAGLALAGLCARRPARTPLRQAPFAYALAFLALLAWWSTIRPSNDLDFAPDVAHGVTGVLRGDELTLQNVRNFTWRAPKDFTENWEERNYDLKKLTSVDFYLVYFMGPMIAHAMASFNFEDGRHLMFSIEIRPERGQGFSPVAGFFRAYTIIFLAADERDFLFLRKANDEDVRLFRIKASPDQARALLLQYVSEANSLAERPQFYNTITANCTTVIFTMLRTLTSAFPRDWRVLLNGFLPSYLAELGLVDTSIPLDELIRRAAVSDRIEMGLTEQEFGARLRQGLPDPNARAASGGAAR